MKASLSGRPFAGMTSSGACIDGVEDWFNTHLGYLQCVSRCTSVRSILDHVDVIMGDMVHVRTYDVILYDEISSSNYIYIYMQCIGYES